MGKIVAEGAVELAGDVARHLDVLHLVLADRHEMRAIDQNVGGHQHRIVEQADAGVDALVDLLLVRDGPLQQAHVGDGAENPGQFRHLRHVGLAEEDGLVGIEAEREIIEGDVERCSAQQRRVRRF